MERQSQRCRECGREPPLVPGEGGAGERCTGCGQPVPPVLHARRVGAALSPFDFVHSEETFQRLLGGLFEQHRQQAQGGLTAEQLDGLARVMWGDASGAAALQDAGEAWRGECAICQEAYCVGEETIALACGHLFHGECLILWLLKVPSCPSCRKAVAP